jgi:hypothetical protein
MKSTTRLLLSSLFLLSFALCVQTAAQSSASGSYNFTLTDDLTRSLQFDAVTDERGVTSGRMIFSDQTRIVDKEDDSGDPDPRPGDGFAIQLAADFDAMTVEKNRAVMSGTIIDSTHRSYIGRWVQLVVEDNGQDPRRPDRLVWTLCRPEPGGWIPSDYDQPGDNGAYLKWWATDAERKDDAGIPSPNLIPGERKGCLAYTLAAYDWAVVKKWEGDIRVVQ